MELFSIILIILNLLILFSFFIFYKRIKNSIKEKLEKYKFNKEENINKKYEELLNKKQQEYSERINKLNEELKEKQELYKNIIEQNESIIKNEEEKKNLILNQKQEIIDKELENYKIQQIQKLQQNLNIKETELNNQLFQFKEKIEEDKKEALDILNSILEELEDYRKRREVINEAILREKELKEKETFYKINISENDIEDIEVLKTIEYKLKNREALNKLIFDVYISKPMKEMIKRVLCGGAPSGIYKITYIPTGEAYIGRSTDVSNRFKEHILSCFSIGHIAHSSLHTKMARDGIWNFTFELLEEVEKDKLNEREKYWIDFYNTKTYGLNEKRGNQ